MNREVGRMANANNLNLSAVQGKLETFVAKLKSSIRVSGAYLFGSYAKGNATPDSDIDVLVLSPDFSGNRFEDLLLLMKARRGIDLRIDPHLLKDEEFNENHPLFREIKDDLIQIV